MYVTTSVTPEPEVRIDVLTFTQIMNNFALEPHSKLCSFHNLFVNRNVCQISMRFEEANCAWNNWFPEVQLWRFGRNCCRWTGFIWSLLVTQVVTYVRTTPTPLLLLFIPYKVLVRMMIKFRITKEKEIEEGTIKRPQQNVYVFFFNKSVCEKIWCCIFLSFALKNMLRKVISTVA